MAFDAEGALWVASIISNRVIRITPDGRQHVVIEDSDPAFMEMIEQRLRERSLQRPTCKIAAKLLQNIASITFAVRICARLSRLARRRQALYVSLTDCRRRSRSLGRLRTSECRQARSRLPSSWRRGPR